ncbi:hypothetical protein LCGC14_2932950 [marine sediment metagenome]|uniref:Uncharacterized protein n=1 Tax=marine sediment metagenome TaxID=412755 RepID=A0A0F8XK94_9ZZZZ
MKTDMEGKVITMMEQMTIPYMMLTLLQEIQQEILLELTLRGFT